MAAPSATAPLVGIFVGGRGSRMGGVAKGLLAAPDTGEPIAGRLVRACRTALPDAAIVLVGEAAAYAALALPALRDEPPGVGPLGGLVALLAEGERRRRDAIALATDLPYVTTEMVALLATHRKGAAAVAPRLDGRWEPLFARYAAARCLPFARRCVTEGRHAVRGVLEALGEEALVLPVPASEQGALRDWDTREDVRKGRSG